MLETLNGLNAIFQNFPDIPVVVWLNHHYGDIKLDGVRFEDTQFYRDNMDRIHGIIEYGSSKVDTFAHDIQMMLKDGLTFEEGIEGPNYFVHSRQRLAMTWRDLDSKMELLKL